MSLKDWAQKKNRELNRKAHEDLDSHSWHSASYHRYFEGYQEYETADEKGRRILRRVYMGKTYRQQLEGSRYVLQRAVYVLLLAACIAVLVLSGRLQGGRATPFYVVLPEMATVCLLAWAGYVLLVNYIPAPREMTIHDYHSSAVSLNKSTFFLSIAFAADIAVSLIDCLLNGTESAPLTIPAFFAAGAVCSFALHMMEKNVHYI